MKIYQGLLIVCLLLWISPAHAAQRNCLYKTFERFQLVEKSGHKLAWQKPNEALALRILDFEIQCPWQIEADLNGDNKKDWVGLVKKDNKFFYLAYLSAPRAYQIINLREYDFFPEATHLSLITTREAGILQNKRKNSYPTKYALVLNRIRKNSEVYTWDGKSLSFRFSYKGDF